MSTCCSWKRFAPSTCNTHGHTPSVPLCACVGVNMCLSKSKIQIKFVTEGPLIWLGIFCLYNESKNYSHPFRLRLCITFILTNMLIFQLESKLPSWSGLARFQLSIPVPMLSPARINSVKMSHFAELKNSVLEEIIGNQKIKEDFPLHVF